MIDFERAFTGVDYRTALANICTIVGRPVPNDRKVTRADMIAATQARAMAAREQLDAQYFAISAQILAESALENIAPQDPERSLHTRLLSNRRNAPVTEYRAWLDRDPHFTAALVHAGREYNRRRQSMLAAYIVSFSKERSAHAV